MNEFLDVYNKLSRDTISLIDTIYTEDITFIDPAHHIKGLDNLRTYFGNLFANVDHIHFEFFNQLRSHNEGYVQWNMKFSHPKLQRGKEITVHGTTFVHFSPDNKVDYHRDYFDLTNMLHQHLPLIGPLVKSINRRLGS